MSGRLLDVREVAEWLGVPVSWVRESTRSGAMPCVPLGRYQRYDRGDVEAGSRRVSGPVGRSCCGAAVAQFTQVVSAMAASQKATQPPMMAHQTSTLTRSMRWTRFLLGTDGATTLAHGGAAVNVRASCVRPHGSYARRHA